MKPTIGRSETAITECLKPPASRSARPPASAPEAIPLLKTAVDEAMSDKQKTDEINKKKQ